MAWPRCTSPYWELLKGFVLASAVAQDEPIRTGPTQNYSTELCLGQSRGGHMESFSKSCADK